MAFDFSQSFSGINGALLNLGKRFQEQADSEALLKAFDATQGSAGMRPSAMTAPSAPALTGPGDYFSRTRSAESSNDPNAKNPRSSASGLYQFLDGTWAGLMKSNPELGLTADGRSDPAQQEKAMRAFTGQNADALRTAGIDPTDRNLYMSHFLGAGASPNFIRAVQQDPSVPSTSLVDARVAAANRPVFYNEDGTPRTAGDVYDRMTRRFGDGSTAIAALGGGRQPVQVAQADAPAAGAAEAQGFLIPGAQPATRENINGGMIRALLANPGTRDVGKALWQQAMTGKQFGFQVVGDQLYRTDPTRGTVEPVGIVNPKTQLDMENTRVDIALKNKQLNAKKDRQSVKGEDGTLYDFDPESLLITLRVVDDVTPSDYEYSYDLQGCSPLSLTEGSGIVVDDVAKTITIDPGADFRLEAGNYEHGLLSVHKVTRLAQQIFDGSGVVSRSPNA